MGDRPLACPLPVPAEALTAELEHSSAAERQAAGKMAVAAGKQAADSLPAGIRPVRQDCLTSCQGAEGCQQESLLYISCFRSGHPMILCGDVPRYKPEYLSLQISLQHQQCFSMLRCCVIQCSHEFHRYGPCTSRLWPM